MAKKRRHAAAQREAAAVNREVPVDPEALEKSLRNLHSFFDRLSAEVVRVPSSLERTLLLHSLVALVVQNVLMVAQSVSTAQITLVTGTAFWMMRKSFVTMLLPDIALRSNNNHEIFSRISVLVLVLSALGAAFYCVGTPPTMEQLLLLGLVVLLDVASIHLVNVASGRVIGGQIVLSAVEVTFLVACFSTCLNYKRGLIYDHSAFALTASTAFVHAIVLLSAKYVVLHCFSSDMNGAFKKTQQRGAKLMEDIWEDIDRFEPEQLFVGLAGASKKKKLKNKPRSSSKVTCTDDCSLESHLLPRHSIFKEPRVQLAILTLLQMLLLLSQVLLSTFVLYSWEMMSALMFSSSHVLWTLGQVRRTILSHKTIGSADEKLKNE